VQFIYDYDCEYVPVVVTGADTSFCISIYIEDYFPECPSVPRLLWALSCYAAAIVLAGQSRNGQQLARLPVSVFISKTFTPVVLDFIADKSSR